MTSYDAWIYGILFLLIFAETGLVIMPFLPGDSILFLLGSLAAFTHSISITKTIFILSLAATIGDLVNFKLGQHFSQRIQPTGWSVRLISPRIMNHSKHFFANHVNSTIFIGRFVPIIRTLIPFTAGMSGMQTATFTKYNVIGGITWIMITSLSRFFLGNITFVKTNFEFIIIGIVLISCMPMIISILKKQLPLHH